MESIFKKCTKALFSSPKIQKLFKISRHIESRALVHFLKLPLHINRGSSSSSSPSSTETKSGALPPTPPHPLPPHTPPIPHTPPYPPHPISPLCSLSPKLMLLSTSAPPSPLHLIHGSTHLMPTAVVVKGPMAREG